MLELLMHFDRTMRRRSSKPGQPSAAVVQEEGQLRAAAGPWTGMAGHEAIAPDIYSVSCVPVPPGASTSAAAVTTLPWQGDDSDR